MTLEGRVVALALRIFGVAVIGYLTAHIAVFLLGEQIGAQTEGAATTEALQVLRDEIAQLRKAVELGADSASGNAEPTEEASPLRSVRNRS